MNECLSAYVDPAPEDTRRRRRYSNRSESTEQDSDADSRRTADGSDRIEVITRAAELLREAMDLEEGGGGVLFLDTSLATTSLEQPESLVSAKPQELPRSSDRHGSSDPAHATEETLPDALQKPMGSTEVLAHTYQSGSLMSDVPEFTPFTPEELLKLIKKFPRGRMFTYDQQGQELSDSTDSEINLDERPRSKQRRKRSTTVSAVLHAHFPKARQVIFMPIWDSTTSRSGACFVYNCSEYRNFTRQLDFLHCITFNNCVDTELLRLSNLKAVEQKNDFIGSISHELRSPLHGILASCEFLQDTTCTSFQKSLVSTAESCARTLLDTVNMVLDYSKINAFERGKAVNAALGLADDFQSKHSKAVRSKLSAYRAVDLSVLTEEVVEGVATGHAFDNPRSRAVLCNSGEVTANPKTSDELNIPNPSRPDVELVVEIAEQDWTYWCEPGFIRRVVMNLVGNALKYTDSGFVHVKLETQSAELDTTEYGILTVTDSGQGISPAYLKDKLFTPFAQESNQAPGVGLGLSLVKSIMDTIGGHINIESTLGTGTKATVRFPLVRSPPSSPGLEINGDARPKGHDDTAARTKTPRSESVALYQDREVDAPTNQQDASRLLHQTLSAYLATWSEKPIVPWTGSCSADIVVVEEAALNTLLRECPKLSSPDCQTKVLVLHSTDSTDVNMRKSMEHVRHPVGPHKLTRALEACGNRSSAKAQNETTEDTPTTRADDITAMTAHLNISDDPASCPATHDSQRPVQAHANGSDTISPSATDNSSPKPKKSSPASENPSPSQRVLIVDDNTINLRLLQVGMKKRGYTSITSASDGLQAVNTYRSLLHASPSAPPDIILMDLSMPVMNGFEATRQIRAIEAKHNNHLTGSQAPHHSLIVALTGLASVRDQKEAYTAGVDSYIMKPVSFAKLTTLLQGWTEEGKVVEAAPQEAGTVAAV